MMLTSTPIGHAAALKLGLVDEVVPKEQLLAAAKAWALDIAAGRKPRLLSLTRSDRIEPLGEALPILEFARQQVGGRPAGWLAGWLAGRSPGSGSAAAAAAAAAALQEAWSGPQLGQQACQPCPV
jgi:enoyl-CoA hydratase/3-hydroxyacyl-CoA dehydrogenase